MNFEELINQYGLYLSTFIVCFVSGFIPIVNAEVFLLLVSSISPKSQIISLVFLSTMGQMAAKGLIYLGASGVLKIPFRRYEKKMNMIREKFERWKSKTDLLILFSAAIGFPPFYLVSVMAGALKLNYLRFLFFGFIGRFVRFSVALLLPQFIKGFIQ